MVVQDVATPPAAKSPAEVYDEKFVPALFGPWGPVISQLAGIAPGHAVLDVGCGTGALALAAAAIVGPAGRVVGLDANPEMLAVARRKVAKVEWQEGVAEEIPFGEAVFDAVVSQFALMFFNDRERALRQMWRVLKPGGRLAIAVCADVERSPGYAAFADLLDRLFGRRVGDAFRAPFVLGQADHLRQLASAADIGQASVEEKTGTVCFRSIADLVSTERACVWTLGGILEPAQFARLLQESQTVLRPFADTSGVVRFAMPALILLARKTQ